MAAAVVMEATHGFPTVAALGHSMGDLPDIQVRHRLSGMATRGKLIFKTARGDKSSSREVLNVWQQSSGMIGICFSRQRFRFEVFSSMYIAQ